MSPHYGFGAGTTTVIDDGVFNDGKVPLTSPVARDIFSVWGVNVGIF